MVLNSTRCILTNEDKIMELALTQNDNSASSISFTSNSFHTVKKEENTCLYNDYAEKIANEIIQQSLKQSSEISWWLYHSDGSINEKLKEEVNSATDSSLHTVAIEPRRSSVHNAQVHSEFPRSVFSRVLSYKSSLIKNNLPDLPTQWDMNNYTGETKRIIKVERRRHRHGSAQSLNLNSAVPCIKPTPINAVMLSRAFPRSERRPASLHDLNDHDIENMIGSERSAFKPFNGNHVDENVNSNSKNTLTDSDNEGECKDEEFLEEQTKKMACSNKRKTDENSVLTDECAEKNFKFDCTRTKKKNFPSNLKHSLCNIFKFHKSISVTVKQAENGGERSSVNYGITSRSLPPIPNHLEEGNCYADGKINEDPDVAVGNTSGAGPSTSDIDETSADEEYVVQKHGQINFQQSLEEVKDYGWYWGPMSGEEAEKILSSEPDGSFLVRDSSDDRHIFSLTFKLHDIVRHVRIEYTQGSFSFGSYVAFRSQTIVEFIENAMEYSRNGRYLFFLHRRPLHGPIKLQILYPVSRFKYVQSLQHLCRFAILRTVRRDLVSTLPLPPLLIKYLNAPRYYTEEP